MCKTVKVAFFRALFLRLKYTLKKPQHFSTEICKWVHGVISFQAWQYLTPTSITVPT